MFIELLVESIGHKMVGRFDKLAKLFNKNNMTSKILLGALASN
jgi:hypothetical protein